MGSSEIAEVQSGIRFARTFDTTRSPRGKEKIRSRADVKAILVQIEFSSKNQNQARC